MTREEAITRIKNMAWLYGSVEREQNIEAIDMAIEALSADTVSRFHHDMEVKELKHQIKDQADMVLVVRCKDCIHWASAEDYDCEIHNNKTFLQDSVTQMRQADEEVKRKLLDTFSQKMEVR